MRVSLGLALIAPAFAAMAAVACSTNVSDGEASSAAASTASDLALAKQAAQLIDGDGAKCNACHTAGKDDMERWLTSYKAVQAACLDTTSNMTALERVNCLRDDPNDATSTFSPDKIGILSAGAGLVDFKTLFAAAYPADGGSAELAAFVKAAAMPAFGGPGFSQTDFNTVKSWFDKGLNNIDDVLQAPGAFACTPSTSPELLAHITDMQANGWGARLQQSATSMALCGAETDPTKCLTSVPDVTATFGAEGTAGVVRQLRALPFTSNYWVRSSPDGRFAALGGSPSHVVDLTLPDTAPAITTSAPYDPGFFPNNDGFSFAGTSGGITVCKTSVLLNAEATGSKINFTEPSCTGIISTVYQSVGAALDGSLYFMSTGTHTNDPGTNGGPLSAAFGDTATSTLTPMFNDGSKYVPGANITVATPNEGDQQMSASNQLLMTRFGQKAGVAGYHFRMLTPHIAAAAAGTTEPAVTVDAKVIGTACIQGGKPQLSFDERFLAVHQYVDPANNPKNLPAGSSNIFINDLKTGKTVQVTKMAAGQNALYPHFRADGWLYFLLRDHNTGKETLLASDAALHITQ